MFAALQDLLPVVVDDDLPTGHFADCHGCCAPGVSVCLHRFKLGNRFPVGAGMKHEGIWVEDESGGKNIQREINAIDADAIMRKAEPEPDQEAVNQLVVGSIPTAGASFSF